MKAQNKLEHSVFNSWKKNTQIENLRNYSGRLLVGVSGGQDSMVLLRILIQCFPKERLVVAHVHHGNHGNVEFRDRSSDLVAEFCKKNGLAFENIKADHHLKSEADFRSFRLESFKSVCLRYNILIVAMAHHRDDWLENQLIKLIRGSSFASLRRNFQWSWSNAMNYYIWRPLISSSKAELFNYLKEKQIPYLDDPSNSDPSYLRNWIRTKWLPLLESERPGSLNRMTYSLIHSLSEIETPLSSFPWDFKTHSIDFIYFLSLSEAEKLRCLAFYVSTSGLKNIKSSQLKEIIKQLDNASDRSHIHFKTFDCLVNAGQLFIRTL